MNRLESIIKMVEVGLGIAVILFVLGFAPPCLAASCGIGGINLSMISGLLGSWSETQNIIFLRAGIFLLLIPFVFIFISPLSFLDHLNLRLASRGFVLTDSIREALAKGKIKIQ